RLRAVRDRRDRDRRRQPDGRRGQRVRRRDRRGADLPDPQQPDHVRGRRQLVRPVRRTVHHLRGSARADPRKDLGLSGSARATLSAKGGKSMKRLMLSAAAAALLAAPGAAGAADYTFALVPKNVNNPFFDVARDGCKKAEEELGGKIECLYIGPGEHGGGEEQLQMVNDLITRQVDGIAVSPSNAAGIVSALVQAKQAGIPVLTWDSDLLPENADLRIAYIGTKNYDIGVNLAK